MTALGQSEKNSMRAYVFRFGPQFGHCSTQAALRIWANSVEKVLAAVGTKFFKSC
jgi:hypothetical protein